ncbi:DnaJ domain-containing protein [Ophiocordyceps camponoti-floridani]|uniref:DnaJ domain-containing protein n=1 Tax=Ophiocordyceps camponoti-floridani TaxID=2030778 RepID=A0A8H4QC42_9HYPO|nr:DnaJ domain-containing protein [Ophiocordyceps camponoti-floridani]
MRIAHVSVGLLLALVAPAVAGWSKEDREIFRIRDEITAHEPDPKATFYDILGVSRGASQEDINRAYRKKSRSLHPDKVTQQLKTDRARTRAKASASEIKVAVKRASERQARLSLIANILRGPSRDRYDHFLSHGFPLWKGTDYYYSRYRPGLGTVVFGLFLMGGGGLHYLILYMSWKRQKEFVERYVRFARETAWGSGFGSIPGIDAAMADGGGGGGGGDDDTPPPVQPMNRRQRRMQDKESRREDGSGRAKKKGRKAAAAGAGQDSGPSPSGARKRVVAENGKILVVDSQGDVFLEEEDEDGVVNEFLLDPNELRQPTFKDTAVVRVPLWLVESVTGRFRSKTEDSAADSDSAAGDDSDAPQRTPSTDSAGDDFEIVDKSTDSLAKVKTSGAQQQGSKPHKRRNKKR